MFKPFSLIFFIAVFAWIVSIFLTTDGSERIERTCSPVEIFGKVAVSGTALVADQFTNPVQVAMNQWVYGCRYVVWRSVYEEDYLNYLMEAEASKSKSDMSEMSVHRGQNEQTGKIIKTPVKEKHPETTQVEKL